MNPVLDEEKTERLLDHLAHLREASGTPKTVGLDDEVVADFLREDARLAHAIEHARAARDRLSEDEAALVELDEIEACVRVQKQYVNFYPADGVNAYLPMAAKGPWIVTAHGAVIHDSGGYGMLGLGHNPDEILLALGQEEAMANVMTPNLAQKRLSDRLLAEIGHARGACPMPRFICMNSGSEAVTVSARIADIHARRMTDPGGRHEGRRVKTLAMREGFHGRTDRPARFSDSTRGVYEEHLASYRGDGDVEFVEYNDEEALREAFARAEKDGVFFDAVYLEPVMGEGMPGLAVKRSFYDLARELASDHGSLLVVDSIQAAIRAQGCLSIVDYPGFEDCAPPDMETYSKALNAGQFPLSVLAMTEEVADVYVTGVYGNTMTTNPKALAVACCVLDSLSDEVREHVRSMGDLLTDRLRELAERHEAIVRVDGTGLMVGAHLDADRYVVNGAGGFEEWLRTRGVQMIHGGENGLRFTPHFAIGEKEIDLIVGMVEKGLKEL